MSDYQIGSIEISEHRLRQVFRGFNRFMLLLWRLGLGAWGNGTSFGGSVMVIKHTGRRTGLQRQTPVNYTIVDGDIYCTAGFGKSSDWYLNIMADPEVEVWLPDSRWAGFAEDVTNEANSHFIFRQVLFASGFAGPLFGVNPRKLSDLDPHPPAECTYWSRRTRRPGLGLASCDICVTWLYLFQKEKMIAQEP